MKILSKKRKVGILTFSDGRKFVHQQEYEVNKSFEERLVKVLESSGEVECVRGEIIRITDLARSEAIKMANDGRIEVPKVWSRAGWSLRIVTLKVRRGKWCERKNA